MGWDSSVSYYDPGDTLPKWVIKKELLASVIQVASAAASLIINKLLMVSNCDTSRQNEINSLAQLTLDKRTFTLYFWFKTSTQSMLLSMEERQILQSSLKVLCYFTSICLSEVLTEVLRGTEITYVNY